MNPIPINHLNYSSRRRHPHRIAIFIAVCAGLLHTAAAAPAEGSRCKSELHSQTPDKETLHIDIDGDGKPDLIERWWKGKRCRWLDETGTLRPDDLRGNMENSVLQVDMDGDGFYDGPEDMNVKWCDTDGDGIPDVQSFAINPKTWGATAKEQTGDPVWMLFINHDKRGVLGWVDWEKFDFDCWAHTDRCNWLPNYHGNCDFVKIHAPAWSLRDLRFNWENPFSFYDETGDGVSKMAMRWCAPDPRKNGRVEISPRVDSAFLTYDLDGNSGYGNETSYDMTLEAGGAEVDVSAMEHPLPGFKGDPKFDACFRHNEWRRIDRVCYMDRDKGYAIFFRMPWTHFSLVFDEDGDDHRWERVELMYPTVDRDPNSAPVDPYSSARANNRTGQRAGLCTHFQSDTLGDRGEFDTDGSGGGKLYIGVFDRKLHLYRAKWGAWTVDKNAEFHGGAREPTNRPAATKVGELVKYTDSDGDGFIDTIEYDYQGAHKFDLKVCLLDYKTAEFDPQKADLIDPARLGWKGMHLLFNQLAQDSWTEALQVYRAAWKRDLTDPELDKLAAASSMRQRHMNAYWIKEGVFRKLSAQVTARIAAHPEETEKLKQYLASYIRAYYTGHFGEVVQLLAQSPAR